MKVAGPPEVPIRHLAAAVAVLLLASHLFAAFHETHVNEITAPVATYVAGRVAALEAQATRTAAEKKELKLLKPLAKKLDKTALFLKQDFAELAAAGAVIDKLGAAAAAMQPGADEAVVRANLSLSERVELAGDYLALLVVPKHRTPVQKALATVSAARGAAAAATTAKKRTSQLAKADAAVTSALKTADKFVLLEIGAGAVPPTRLRSGDLVGFGGGRVAVPRDSGTALAGASILFPVGVLQSPVHVTLDAAPPFVGGKDLAAGPALAVGPDGFAVGAGVTLSIPYQLPDGTSALDLALLAKGPPQTTIVPVTAGADGLLSAAIASFSTFEAAIAAPPPGQPGGTYQVQTFVVNTSLDPNGTGVPAGADSARLLVGVLAQTATFRPDHTASASLPGFPLASRTFIRAQAPHHTDDAQFGLGTSADFTWTAGDAGRFSSSMPVGGGVIAAMQGSASDDGRIVTWSGRGSTLEFVAVGVKIQQGNVTADLAGRWAAVELGAELLDGAAEPFRTRWHNAFRSFTVDTAGAVTFDAQGQRFETELTYHSGEADPTHTRVENVLADGGTETWTVGATGLADTAGKRFGWFDKTARLLTSTYYDPAARRIELMVAVPQPAIGDPSVVPGLYHWAGLDIATSVGIPSADSSTHDVTPSSGSLDVTSATAATLDADATTRVVYTLSTAPPSITFRWFLDSASTTLAAASKDLTLALDAAGNHVAPADPFWFAFSGDGRVVLRLTRGDATGLARGIAIGVR